MIQEIIILNILLIFTPSISAISSIQAPSSAIKNVLNKCCPMGRYVVNGKKCADKNNITVSFSTIKIYDKDKQLTGKSFDDLFTLKPNKFKNETFRRNIDVLDVIRLDYNVYLTESGLIQVELPNAYDRWTPIRIDDYCIDMDYRLPGPRFWALIESEETQNTDVTLQIIGIMISCFFILVVLLVYILLPELQNLCGLILMAYLFSLFMAFTLLVIIQLPNVSINNACLGLASGVYFFFLAVFCWMSVMSYNMWTDFRSSLRANSHRRENRCKFLVYCLYAWGVPLLMTIFLVLVNTYRKDMRSVPWFVTPRIPENGCFLHGGVKLLYFYLPMLVLIICNWIFYLMTAFNICLSNRKTSVLDTGAAGPKLAHRDQRRTFIITLKLSVVMGLSWLLEIISFWYPNYMWVISDVYNSLIGLAMFLIFVCKRNILKKLSERCGRRKIMRWTSKSTESSKVDFSQENIALQLKVSSQPNGLNTTDNESEKEGCR